jgi:hypothetical protein
MRSDQSIQTTGGTGFYIEEEAEDWKISYLRRCQKTARVLFKIPNFAAAKIR